MEFPVELKKYLSRCLLLPLLISGVLAPAAWSADELIVYVFRDGAPASGLSVFLDGADSGQTRADGSLAIELAAGSHGLDVREGDGDPFTTAYTDAVLPRPRDLTLPFCQVCLPFWGNGDWENVILST